MTTAVSPDPVATLRSIILGLAETAGDDAPVIRSRRAPGDVPPFTLLRDAGELRARHAPVRRPARVSAQLFGLDEADAARRYRRFSDLVHGYGPAIVELEDEDGGDVGVWKVFDETGVQAPLQEPDTGWWVAGGVFDLYMTDRSVG